MCVCACLCACLCVCAEEEEEEHLLSKQLQIVKEEDSGTKDSKALLRKRGSEQLYPKEQSFKSIIS